MTDWRDHEPGRSGLSVARLHDGESLQVRGVAEPYREETEESKNALHVPVEVVDFPEGMADMSSAEISEGDEYNIINSSSSFFSALLEAFPEGESLNGEVFTITAQQPNDSYSRYYEVTRE